MSLIINYIIYLFVDSELSIVGSLFVDGFERFIQCFFYFIVLLYFQVKLSVYASYLSAIGTLNSTAILVFFLLYQACSVYSSIWLSDWTSDTVLNNDTLKNTSQYEQRQDLRLGVYGALGVAQGFYR